MPSPQRLEAPILPDPFFLTLFSSLLRARCKPWPRAPQSLMATHPSPSPDAHWARNHARKAARSWCARIASASVDGPLCPAFLDSILAELLGVDPAALNPELVSTAIGYMPGTDRLQCRAILGSLCRKGLDLQQASTLGRGALHRASYHPEGAGWVWALLEQGFDPASLDERGDTPLHDGAAQGCLESARALLEYGAPLDLKNHQGHDAESMARPELALFLVSERERRALLVAVESEESSVGSTRL